jgi:hypothetical protein
MMPGLAILLLLLVGAAPAWAQTYTTTEQLRGMELYAMHVTREHTVLANAIIMRTP